MTRCDRGPHQGLGTRRAQAERPGLGLQAGQGGARRSEEKDEGEGLVEAGAGQVHSCTDLTGGGKSRCAPSSGYLSGDRCLERLDPFPGPALGSWGHF